MRTDEALSQGFCKYCNLWQKIKKIEMCVATRLPSLNYRDTKEGNCALTTDEIQERRKDGRIE